jgi:hypothetical protein
VKLPANVGAPVRTPEVDSVTPAGRAPAETDHVYGATPPVATSVVLNALPTTPFGTLVVEIRSGAALTTSVNVVVIFTGMVEESVALKVSTEFPSVDVVPEIRPLEESVRPAGSVPETSANVTGALPPFTANCALYAVPVVAIGRAVVANARPE